MQMCDFSLLVSAWRSLISASCQEERGAGGERPALRYEVITLYTSLSSTGLFDTEKLPSVQSQTGWICLKQSGS